MVCSAAPKMKRLVPDRGSVYADEGTAAHEIAARCLKQEVDTEHFAGMAIEVENESGDTWIPLELPETEAPTSFSVIAGPPPMGTENNS